MKRNGYDRYLDHQYRRSGSFFNNLFLAIHIASSGNLAKLALGFPEEVDAYKTWTRIGVEEFAKKCANRDGQFDAFCKEYQIDIEALDSKGDGNGN